MLPCLPPNPRPRLCAGCRRAGETRYAHCEPSTADVLARTLDTLAAASGLLAWGRANNPTRCSSLCLHLSHVSSDASSDWTGRIPPFTVTRTLIAACARVFIISCGRILERLALTILHVLILACCCLSRCRLNATEYAEPWADRYQSRNYFSFQLALHKGSKGKCAQRNRL